MFGDIFEPGPKWTVQKGESGRSSKWTVFRQTGRSFDRKWTAQDDSGRSFEPKWTVMGQCRRSFDLKWTVLWMNRRVEVDGPKVSKWTVQKCQSGRSKSVKVDGPKIFCNSKCTLIAPYS